MSPADLNKQPVIGIVTQTFDESFSDDPRFAGYDSYIMSAYVKFLESAGARIIPMIRSESREVTLDKLSKVNGILFPGGTGDYIEYGQFIFDTVKQINDNGTYFPLWGTCLGF